MQKTLLGALAAVFLYNLFFFGAGLGIGTGLFFLLVHSYLFFTRNKDADLVSAVSASLVSIFFGFLEGFRANSEVQFINLLVSLATTILAVYFYRISWKERLNISHSIAIPFRVAGRSIVALFSLVFLKEEKGNGSASAIGPILRGVLITIPIFLVLLLLLTQADAVFRNFTTNFLSQSIERIVLSTFLLGVLASFGLSVYKKVEEKVKNAVGAGKSYELGILGGSIAILFGLFIMIQFQYLFSQVGERELGELGIKSLTYSEYVRKGFFELLVVSSIAGGVISYVLHYLYALSKRSKTALQLLTGLLTIETFMLLYSAFTRLVLYADAHGLTRARIWGFLFLLWLAGMLVVLLFRTIRELSSEKTAYSVIGITIVIFLGMNIVNIDGLIATKYRPTVNNEIDYSYISLLSADAYTEWDDAIKDSERKITTLESKGELTDEDWRIMVLVDMTTMSLKTNLAVILQKYGTEEEYYEWWYGDSYDPNLPENEIKKREIVKEIIAKQKWQEFNMGESAVYPKIEDEFEFYVTISSLRNRLEKLKERYYQKTENVIKVVPIDRPENPPVFQ